MTRSSQLPAAFFRITACAALLLTVACGPEADTGSAGPSSSNSNTTATPNKSGREALLGTWRGTPIEFNSDGRSFDITMRMTFERARVGMNARCRFDTGDTLEADTFVRAELTDTHVRTLESNEQEVRLNGLHCNASLGKFNARYRIEGQTLTLTFEDGEALALTRE